MAALRVWWGELCVKMQMERRHTRRSDRGCARWKQEEENAGGKGSEDAEEERGGPGDRLFKDEGAYYH